jgi:hypothetical protein
MGSAVRIVGIEGNDPFALGNSWRRLPSSLKDKAQELMG